MTGPPRRRRPQSTAPARGRAASPPSRRDRPEPDPARRAAFDLLRAVDERDAYANLALPGLLRDRGSTVATPRSPPSSATGPCAGWGRTTPSWPPASTGRSTRSTRRCGTCCGSAPTSCCRCACPRTPRWGRRSSWPGRWSARARRSSSTPCCAGSARQRAGGMAGRVAPAFDEDPVGSPRRRALAPALGGSAFRDALGGSLEETAAALAADNAAGRGDPGCAAGSRDGGRARRGGGAGRAAGRRTPRSLPGGDPGAAAGGARGPSRSAGRGQPAGGAGPRRGRGGGRRTERWLDLCAGPGGKAALLGALARERGAMLLAAELAPHRAGSLPRAVRSDAGCRGGGRPSAGLAGRHVRPGAGRRAVHRPGGVAAPAGGAVAPAGGDVAGAGGAPAGPARAALDAARPGGVVAYVTCSPHLAETPSGGGRRAPATRRRDP